MRTFNRYAVFAFLALCCQFISVRELSAQCTTWQFHNTSSYVVELTICGICPPPGNCITGIEIDPGEMLELCINECVDLTFTVGGVNFDMSYEGPIGTTGACVCWDDLAHRGFIYNGPCGPCP